MIPVVLVTLFGGCDPAAGAEPKAQLARVERPRRGFLGLCLGRKCRERKRRAWGNKPLSTQIPIEEGGCRGPLCNPHRRYRTKPKRLFRRDP